MENNPLNHSGIKDMRWGQRRWQNKDGSLTPAGRERYRKNRKSDSDRREESLDEKKQRILKSHSAKEIYENKDLFTDKELQDAYTRLNTENNIKNLIPKEISKGQRFLDGYSNMGKSVKTIVDTSDSLYKSYTTGKELLNKLKKSSEVVKEIVK